MPENNLWKYCTSAHCNEFLLSLQLLGDTPWSDERQLACLYAVSRYPDRHYRQAHIPKRTGGARRLDIPDPLLKSMQRNILHRILAGMPVSPHATAYCPGIGLVRNATPHMGQPMVLRLDISDFFGSILFPVVQQQVFSHRFFPPPVSMLLTSLCCYRDCLPQGASTSPAISNLVMRSFDQYVGQWCGERSIHYTRYCDDMTFSGEFNPDLVRKKIQGFLEAMGFTLNHAKTHAMDQGQRQLVTGLVVNQKTQIPRSNRKELRQEAYYCCKYGPEAHLSRRGDTVYLPEGQAGIQRYLLSLLGKVSFALHVNPQDSSMAQARLGLLALVGQG